MKLYAIEQTSSIERINVKLNDLIFFSDAIAIFSIFLEKELVLMLFAFPFAKQDAVDSELTIKNAPNRDEKRF